MSARDASGGAVVSGRAAAVAEGAPTVREARARYFAANGFDERSYEDRWVRLQAGPVPIWFPNTRSRVRAIRVHDVHHVVTGYATTWTGEAEIGAWEIASGCADHAAAWVLNLLALPVGLAFAPHATFRAFVRGRRTRNLYRETIDDRLLATRVDALAAALGLDRPPGAARAGDAGAFAAWSALALALFAATVAATFAPVLALLVLALR